MTDYYHNSNASGFQNPGLQPPNFYQSGIPVHNQQNEEIPDVWSDPQSLDRIFELPPDTPPMEDLPKPPYKPNPDPYVLTPFQAKLTIQQLSTAQQILQIENDSLRKKLYEEEIKSQMFEEASTELLRVVAGIGGYIPESEEGLRNQLMGAMNGIHELIVGHVKRVNRIY